MYRLLLIVSFFSLSGSLRAQSWYGASTGNYGGIYSVYHNPSWIVDSRYKWHLNLVGFDAYAVNDVVGLKAPFAPIAPAVQNVPFLNRIWKVGPQYYNENGELKFDQNWMRENINGKSKSALTQVEVRLPSFQINLNRKNAISFQGRVRAMVQVTNLAEPLARMMVAEFDSTKLTDKGVDVTRSYSNNSFNVYALAFQEYGLTYGREIMDKGKHYLKGGITAKVYVPLYSAFLRNEGISITPDDTAENGIRIGIDNAGVYYGYVNETVLQEFENNPNPLSFLLGKGFGGDIGFTYEYRPRISSYRYRMDGKEGVDPRKNKYKFRVAAAVTDLGKITFNNKDYVRSYQLNPSSVFHWTDSSTIDLDRYINQFDSFGVMAAFDTLMTDYVGFKSRSTSFSYKMPTAININLDYHIWKGFYAGFSYVQALRSKDVQGIRGVSYMAIAPRFESRMFDVSVPFLLSNNLKSPKLGIALRMGPLVIGSDDINIFLKNQETRGVDIYFGLSYGIVRRKPRDKDKDGVSDKKDLCRKVAGLYEFHGCPDSDKDSIPDKEDKCPDVFGLSEFAGCPDTDGDKVVDASDSCPEVAGKPELAGCPDRDNDGLKDQEDNCPDLAGPLETRGCPDTDKDGLIDPKDECPKLAGPAEFKGCPDTDGDRLPDPKDKCPDKAGPAEFQGCPDTDGDKVPDHNDLCPLEAGLPENNGCPKVEEKIELVEITEEEENVLKEVFADLEFETGKAEIRESSYAALDELILLMEKKPEYRLYVAGHTDNVGNKLANQQLSADRAEAVKTYLVKKGISPERIKTEGFGMDRPVADNASPEGRQKNRRVEFRIIK